MTATENDSSAQPDAASAKLASRPSSESAKLASRPSFAPDRGIGQRLGLWVIGAGVVGALSLPVWRVGIGWPIATLALLGTIAVARSVRDGREVTAVRDTTPFVNGGERVWRVAAGIAAIGLVAVAGLRAAEWLVALCLLTAFAVGSYALAGGRTWIGVFHGLVAWAVDSLNALGWAAGGTRGRAGHANGGGSAWWAGWRTVTGVVIGFVLVVVFGALFWAADPAFAKVVRRVTDDITTTTLLRAVLGFVLVTMATLGAAYLVFTRTAGSGLESTPDERRKLGPAEWVAPLVMLDVLFAVFVWVQVTTLFGGENFVLAPGGPDYADYARDGFVQLVAVTILTLGVVAVLAVWAGRHTTAERVALRVLAGVLCVLTLVIVASALKRMGLYAEAYGFSVPRVLGYAFEVWLGLVFVLLIVAGVRLRSRWLPPAVAAAAVAVMAGLAAVNPEALMARTHIERLDRDFPLDYAYLSALSADAVTEVDRLAEPYRSCVLARLRDELEVDDPWYGLNLSRQRARELFASGSAADGRHRARRLQECRVVDAVTGLLGPHGPPPGVGELLVGGPAAQQPTQVGLLLAEQAVADLPVSCEPGAVAGGAERLGDTGDHAHLGRAAAGRLVALHEPGLGRGRAPLGRVRPECER